jgi:hypothetical protein
VHHEERAQVHEEVDDEVEKQGAELLAARSAFRPEHRDPHEEVAGVGDAGVGEQAADVGPA